LSLSIEPLFPDLLWKEVKIHVAQESPNERPIDAFTRDFEYWQNKWNGAFHSNHCWNRKYIFSIIELPQQPNCWLFGGVFEVISYRPKKNNSGKDCVFYEVKLDKNGVLLIGRLVIGWSKDGRQKGRIPESMLNNMEIHEILPEIYAGIDFPGYSNIDHSFSVLKSLWEDEKSDWFTALSHCKGVYLITDTATGLRYVGSAYGEEGIWSRWNSYFRTNGHGGNVLLKKHLKSKPSDYAEKNFKISLLEQASSRDSEYYIRDRERYWKEVLLSRTSYGLNDN